MSQPEPESADRRAPPTQRDLLHRVLDEKDFEAILGDAQPGLDREKILRALAYARDAHCDQKRKSGDPYISHPMGVAALLIQENLDTDTICAALLHDTVEDCGTTPEDLTERFGKTVSALVDGVSKIGKLQFESKAAAQAENIRKMMLAMTTDLRVILIKLADRLHNISTLQHMPVEKQQRIARETLEIYAPLARRLGISKIQWALEDSCLRYMNPNVYFDLVRKVAQKRASREKFVELLKEEVQKALVENGIDGVVKGRPKSFYSIYKKTLEHNKNLNEVYDLAGIRILVSEVKDCYAALGIVHKQWKPLQNRFKDYIAVPKSNLYQSLHTTVIHPEGQVFEVQIRTHEMDELAERGVAAHWVYKEGLDPQEVAKRKLTWLKQIVGWHEETTDSGQFLENVKLDLFRDQVYVFTPKGTVIEMPAGATALDFAYHIHTDVGHNCVGVQVDGRMIPLDTPLKNAQVVSVLTSKTSRGPGRDWLEMAFTSRAKNKIRQFLRKQNRDDFVDKGAELLEAEIEKRLKALPKDRSLTIPQVLKHEDFQAVLVAAGYPELRDAQIAIGRGDCQPSQLLYKVEILKPPEAPLQAQDVVSKRPAAPRPAAPGGVLVGGQGDMLVRLSKCCNPVIGDEILGYITRGRGVSVHRSDCPNVENLTGDEARQVDVGWDERSLHDKSASYLAEIEVQTNDQPNVLSRVTNVIANFKINIHSAVARVNKQGVGVLRYGLEIKDGLQLGNLLRTIGSLAEVREVYRVNPSKVAPQAKGRQRGKKGKKKARDEDEPRPFRPGPRGPDDPSRMM